MKRFLILSLCGALLFAGCNRKPAQKEVGEPQAESANKGNLVEMSASAQQHIGMVRRACGPYPAERVPSGYWNCPAD